MISAQSYIVDVIEGKRKNFFLKGALSAMSNLFEIGVKIRNFAFDRNWIRAKAMPVVTISIGNIIAGGTGKTPFTQRLAKDLQPIGKVAILSRGYRSQIEKKGETVFLNQCQKIDPKVCGDEPYLLFKSLPKANLFIGKNRVQAAQKAVAEGANLILLDDGMQYRLLHRDVEIVMVRADNLYGGGAYLPRGYLRDCPTRLKQADLIVVYSIQSSAHFEEMREEIQKKTAAPIIGARMVFQCIEMEDGSQLLDLKGMPIGAFCGVGHPTAFFNTLSNVGADLIDKWALLDHISPKKKELILFAERCKEKGAKFLVCSEKDWAKLSPPLSTSIPVGTLKATFEVIFGKERYERLLEKIRALVLKKAVEYVP